MSRQHVNVALLARHAGPGRQELGIARTVRVMTAHAILADRRVLPQERPAFFGMTLITGVIDRAGHEHLVPFAAVGIVARGAADFHIMIL